jgi:hypothetical protein
MMDSQGSTGSPRKANLRIRKELFDAVGAPLGVATGGRRPMPEGDILVVRITEPSVLPVDERPTRFQDILSSMRSYPR